jgi:hypothetical protein
MLLSRHTRGEVLESRIVRNVPRDGPFASEDGGTRPVQLEAGWEKPAEGHPCEAGQARLQMSRHVKVVGLFAGPMGARSSPHALTDMTWFDNVLECGRNAGKAGLIQGGANAVSSFVPQIWILLTPLCNGINIG